MQAGGMNTKTMKENHRTKRQLALELAEARREIDRLKRAQSECRRQEDVLRKSDETLSLFIEHTPAAVAMFDRDMRYIAASRRWITDYGLGGGDIIGRTHYEVFPEIPERWKEIHRRVLSGKTERCEDDEFPRADGRVDWVRWEVLPWYEPGGEIGGIIMFTEVITERKQTEEKMRMANERLQMAQLAAGEGVWDWDLATGKIEWDDEMFRLFGLDPQRHSASFDSWRGVLHPDDRKLAEMNIQEALKGHSLLRSEYRVIHPDGQVHWISSMGRAVYDSRGTPSRMIGICMDVTSRRQREEELDRYRSSLERLVKERTAEIEARNARLEQEISERRKAEEERRKMEDRLLQSQRMEAIGRFAGGIAHDLNNILYPIVVNTEILLGESPEDTDQHHMLQEVIDAAYRQRDLVKQILSFSRRSEQKLEPVHVASLLQDAFKFLRSSLPSTIEIRTRIDASSDLVMGDPVQLYQIILNFVRNSADALGDQTGTIEVALATTHLGPGPETGEGDYLELSVSDTGCGMSEEVREKVFDPFFTTKEVGRGSGMGLPLAYGIVRSYGGNISVESQPGKGSTFTVHIPLLDERTAEQARSRGGRLPGPGRGKILLVDDEAMILSSLQRVLQRLGYEVAPAMDGVEALELFRRDPGEYSLVITDLTMPKMTGLELSRKLMGIRSDIPIVLCTGFSDIISESETRELGIRGLIYKPSNAGELKEAVSRAIEG